MIDYRSMLRREADPAFARFSSKLMPGKEGVIGVRIPRIREIAGLVASDDWRTFLEDEPGCFEEEMLRGLVIATAPMDVRERMRLTDGFLDLVDNWSTCDTFCTHWSFGSGESRAAWGYFSDLMRTGDEFRMRASVVFRMMRFDDLGSTEAVLDDIAGSDGAGRYYITGAAWAVSVCYVRFPERTRELLESGRLSDRLQNKSIQKIRESLRVSAEEKESLKGLRRTSS